MSDESRTTACTCHLYDTELLAMGAICGAHGGKVSDPKTAQELAEEMRKALFNATYEGVGHYQVLLPYASELIEARTAIKEQARQRQIAEDRHSRALIRESELEARVAKAEAERDEAVRVGAEAFRYIEPRLKALIACESVIREGERTFRQPPGNPAAEIAWLGSARAALALCEKLEEKADGKS